MFEDKDCVELSVFSSELESALRNQFKGKSRAGDVA
jgi:hypothetical protein